MREISVSARAIPTRVSKRGDDDINIIPEEEEREKR